MALQVGVITGDVMIRCRSFPQTRTCWQPNRQMCERYTCTDACTPTVDPSVSPSGWIGCFGVPMMRKEENCSLVGSSLNNAFSNEHTQTCAHPSPQNPPTPPRGVSPLKSQHILQGFRKPRGQQRHNKKARLVLTAVNSPPLSLQIHAGTSYRTWRGGIPSPQCDTETVGIKLVQRGWRVRTVE